MRTARLLLVAAGILPIGYAAAGILTDDDVRLTGLLIFLTAVLVLHDGVFMPVVLAAGALIRRFVPAPHRAAVVVAAVCTVSVTVLAVPLLLGPGDGAYLRGLALILATVWAVVALRAIRKRLARSPAPRGQ